MLLKKKKKTRVARKRDEGVVFVLVAEKRELATKNRRLEKKAKTNFGERAGFTGTF